MKKIIQYLASLVIIAAGADANAKTDTGLTPNAAPSPLNSSGQALASTVLYLTPALFFYWLTVDGSYRLYNTYAGHPVTPDLARANFFASSVLYLICGLLWLPEMNLRELKIEFLGLLKRKN